MQNAIAIDVAVGVGVRHGGRVCGCDVVLWWNTLMNKGGGGCRRESLGVRGTLVLWTASTRKLACERARAEVAASEA